MVLNPEGWRPPNRATCVCTGLVAAFELDYDGMLLVLRLALQCNRNDPNFLLGLISSCLPVLP